MNRTQRPTHSLPNWLLRANLSLLTLVLLILAPNTASLGLEEIGSIRSSVSATADTHLLIEALDRADREKLAKSTPAKILRAVTKGVRIERPEPGTRKEKITGEDGRQSDLWIHVPDARKKKYGLLIMLHGYGGNARQLLTVAYSKFANRNGYIIVGPNAMKPLSGKSNPDLPPEILGAPTRHWWTYRSDGMVMAIVDQLAERFPIDHNRVVLSGMSMGGWGSWNIGMRFPDRFSAIIPFAGGLHMGDYATDTLSDNYSPLIDNLKWLPSYNVHGNTDNIVPVRFSQMLAEELKSRKYDHTYDELDGSGHYLNFDENGPMMQRVTKWLTPRKRILHPPEVTHTIISDDHPRQHWLRIDARADQKQNATIRGKIDRKNNIDIETENVDGFTIFIDNDRLKEKSRITVTHNGQKVHDGKVKETVEALIESWKNRRDPYLLHTRMITVDVGVEEDKKEQEKTKQNAAN